MAIESDETVVVTKQELIAQLDSARWQMSRNCREFGDEFSRKLSVKGQLRRSIRKRPSLWGLGVAGLGFLALRLIFRKKNRAKYKNASYEKRRSPLWKTLMIPLLKTAFLAIEPFIASVLKEHISSRRTPSSPHV